MDHQFNSWVGQWEKAIKDGIFEKPEEKSVNLELPKPSKENFFGNLEINTESEPEQKDVDYWNGINNYNYLESETYIFNEAETKNQKIKKLVNSPNPINIDTTNKDSNKSPKSFIDNEETEKLSELKIKMHELENDILRKEILGKNYKQAEKALEKIKSLIDEISNSIEPKRFETQ